MATPNKYSDQRALIQEAKEWLEQNPNEKIVTAARIFHVPPTSVRYAVEQATKCPIGGSNWILTPGQEKGKNSFIQSHL